MTRVPGACYGCNSPGSHGPSGCILCGYSGERTPLQPALRAEKAWLAQHAPNLGDNPPRDLVAPRSCRRTFAVRGEIVS